MVWPNFRVIYLPGVELYHFVDFPLTVLNGQQILFALMSGEFSKRSDDVRGHSLRKHQLAFYNFYD